MLYMDSSQKYGTLLGFLLHTAPIIQGTQKGTLDNYPHIHKTAKETARLSGLGAGEKLWKGWFWGRGLGLYHGGFCVLYHIICSICFVLLSRHLIHSYHYLHLIRYHCFHHLSRFVLYLIIIIVASSVSHHHFYLSSFSPFFIIIINHPLIHSKITNIVSFVFWGVATSHTFLKIYNNLVL